MRRASCRDADPSRRGRWRSLSRSRPLALRYADREPPRPAPARLPARSLPSSPPPFAREARPYPYGTRFTLVGRGLLVAAVVQGQGDDRASALLGMLAIALHELAQTVEGLDVAAPDEQMRERVEDQRGEGVSGILDHRHAAAGSLGLDLERHVRGSKRPG